MRYIKTFTDRRMKIFNSTIEQLKSKFREGDTLSSIQLEAIVMNCGAKYCECTMIITGLIEESLVSVRVGRLDESSLYDDYIFTVL